MTASVRSLGLALALALAGCITTTSMDRRIIEADDSPWLRPSPYLALELEENAARLPWTHGAERIDLVRWFAGAGEPAYETLLQLALDARADVAGSALAALGSTRDERLVPYVRELAWSGEVPLNLRLERARALLMLGDWSEIPLLVDALEADDLSTRALAGYALYRATGDRRGFNPRDEAEVRAESVRRWRAWWREREDEGILASRDEA